MYFFDRCAIVSSLFYPVHCDESLFITVFHKKYPKSFVFNFWGTTKNIHKTE